MGSVKRPSPRAAQTVCPIHRTCSCICWILATLCSWKDTTARSRCLPKKGTHRVFTMLGNTLANLDNEVRFFRDTLSGCVPGDYFLADFTCGHGSSDDPDEIRRKDPVLQAPVPAARANWLGGPLRRYCKSSRMSFTRSCKHFATLRND
jgi:hypothetical protein